jgi:hypothetical protein
MKTIVYILAIALLILHQDAWLWADRRIVFGFLPIGLGYHVAFSFLSAAVWALAVKFAWPSDWEQWAASDDDDTIPSSTP